MATRRPLTLAARSGVARPRVILLWVVVLIVVALGVYAVTPWILPVRISEGPLVQMATESAVAVVWYTTRSAECAVSLSIDGEQRTFAATADGRRNRVDITGLTPGTSYPYGIHVGQRALTENLALQTNRNDGGRYGFIVFGDSGRGSRAQYELAAEMTRAQPPADFLLHTGDLIYSDGARKGFKSRFFAPYRTLLARINFWPCLGNHDIDEAGDAHPYCEVFELPDNGPPGLSPEHNYWFDHNTCRVAVIDSNLDETELRDKVAPWLRAAMSSTEPRWKFVSLHHPPYTGGKYEPTARVQRALVPVFEQTGVDIVFTGHDHMYQRLHPLRGGAVVASGQGVLYIVTGAGGAKLYQPKTPRPDYVATLESERHSFTQVVVDGDALTLRQIAIDGDVIDEYTLHKSAAADTAASSPARTDTAPAP